MLNSKSGSIYRFWLLACLCCVIISHPVCAANKENTLLHGSITRTIAVPGSLLESLLKLNLTSGVLPAKISHLDLNGEGKISGLEVGDQILSASASKNLLTLSVARNDTMFRLRIDLAQASLSRERALLADVLDPAAPAVKPVEPELAAVVVKTTPVKLPATPAKPRVVTEADTRGNNILNDKEIVLMIDCSKSMASTDCPGGLSRWDWCKGETLYIGWSDPTVLKDGLTMVIFSSDYNISSNRTLQDVARVYSAGKPHGLTYLAQPLDRVLNDYFSRRDRRLAKKPLVVAVISDGYPVDIDKVKQVLVSSTYRLSSPNDVRVVFIQISDDREGTKILVDLDNNLASKGARFDLVDTESFNNVRKIGIKQALIDAIAKPQAGGHPVMIQKMSDTNTTESDRQQLEKMILDKQ
jgi:hypothetical protein